ncbi:MAG: hypothetical protein ACXABY_02370 [Candidatus Thorarchaeota archaeon]|jgi:hypothetical protein
MPSPTAQQSHIDRALTNVSISYSNAAYIWDQILPNVPVAKQTNLFFTFPKAAWFRDETAVRAPGARARRADYTLSTDNYVCIEKALAKQVPDEVIKNSDDPLKPLVRATQYVTDQIFKAIEKDVTDLIFADSAWSASATPDPTWDNDASDPLTDVETGMFTVAQSIGREPNVGVMGRGLWRYLKNHPDIIDRLKYGQTPGSPAMVSIAGVADLFGLEKVLISRSLIDSGVEGAAESLGFIGGNHLALLYVPSSPALDEPAAGYTFVWQSREVNRYREDQEHADVVEARMSWDQKITASDAGYLIKSAA